MFRMDKLNPKLYVIQREVKFVHSKKVTNNRKIEYNEIFHRQEKKT